MSVWLVLGGSLLAVFGLALASRLLGLGVEPRLEGRDHALRLAQEHHFDAVDAMIEADGRSALLSDASGQQKRLRPHGNHFVVSDV